MPLAETLSEYVRAAFSGLYVVTFEPDDAIQEIARLCRERDWRLATWDVDRGLIVETSNAVPEATDPLAAVKALPALAEPEGTLLAVMRGLHRLLGGPELVQALEHLLIRGKRQGLIVIVLAPAVQLPPELERLFAVIEHDLPNRSQLLEIARGVATEEGELPEGQDLQAVLDAAAGLTRYEAESAFSLAVLRHGRLAPEPLWELKAKSLAKGGLLRLHRGGGNFDELGGLKSLKAFCKRSLLRPDRGGQGARPRGVLLLGVPGTGKSAFAKALGRETGRPTLLLDVGSLLGSLVGESEQNVRQALRTADAMAPCVLYCDEIEKGLAGATGSGDSGVGSRVFGSILTWLNDHESDVYFVGTCNDISRLPPEFSRAERFDGIFFLDLPGSAERESIWRLHLAHFELEPGQKRPIDEGWTGAEIRSCCRLAALLDLPLLEAGKHVVPVSATAAESVERLRQWAAGRCLSSDEPGLFRRAAAGSASPRRRVNRDASAN